MLDFSRTYGTLDAGRVRQVTRLVGAPPEPRSAQMNSSGRIRVATASETTPLR